MSNQSLFRITCFSADDKRSAEKTSSYVPILNDENSIDDVLLYLGFVSDHPFSSVASNLSQLLSAPRTISIILDFLMDHKPFTSFTIYPAGELAEAFLARLEKRNKQYIIPFLIDKNNTDPLLGYDVISLDQFSSDDHLKSQVDGVLVLHHRREPFLLQTMEGLGFSDDFIQCVFASPIFYRWWQDNKRHYLPSVDNTLFDVSAINNMIVTTNSNISILERDHLAMAFPPEETVIVYMGNVASNVESKELDYFVINADASLDILDFWADYFDPGNIYVATMHVDNYLGLLIHNKYADKTVIHEIYDFSLSYSADRVCEFYSSSTELIQASRLGEYYSLSELPLVVSKRGGKIWQQLTGPPQSYVTYFHGLGCMSSVVAGDTTDSTHLKLVYAGPLTLVPRDGWHGWDYRTTAGLMLAVRESDAIGLTIYNSLHLSEDQNSQFAKEMLAFGSDRDDYHHRQPFDHLQARLAVYDYGWMCLHRDDYKMETPDVELVFSARLNTYIGAGLPVIIDSTWTAAAALINKFQAGIVVDLNSVGSDDLVGYIFAHLNMSLHRDGAIKLREYMFSNNQLVIRQIQDVMRNSNVMK